MKVTEMVTALLGIVNVHGLLVALPEQETFWVVQLENLQLELGFAVTVTVESIPSEHPLEQLGETEPLPEPTIVVKV
jgi:hypothetical protein